jgi:hypothetical protein
MFRVVSAACVFAMVVGVVVAQDAIRRGTVKSVDAEKGTIIITIDGKEETFFLTDRTRVVGGDGKAVAKPLEDKGFAAGAAVMLKSAVRDGKSILIGLRTAGGGQKQERPKIEPIDTSKLKPLPELGNEKYQGFEGGLYPGGKTEPPREHAAAGLALAKSIRPLAADGKPDTSGKIVMLSVGMSNTTQAFSAFQRLADADEQKNPHLVLVDGAQGGMTAFRIKDPDDSATGTKYWSVVDQRLEAARVSRAQVQVAWIKQADAGPTQGFPKYAETLRDELREIVQLMHARFPNLKMVYLSSRTYGGYATTRLNPEPYAFESGFSVKWLIEEQIRGEKELNFEAKKGAVKAPWLTWGPYLWANGTAKNADGLAYEATDFRDDGTHPSLAGQQKVAAHMLKFFKSDATAKLWFVNPAKP